MKAGIDNSSQNGSDTSMLISKRRHKILINCWSSSINTRWSWVSVPDGRIVSSRICIYHIANGFRSNDARRCRRYRLSVKGFENGLCQKDSLLHGNASFIASLDPIAGRTSETVPVRHFPRIAGKSKYNLANRWWDRLRIVLLRWIRSINYQVAEDHFDCFEIYFLVFSFIFKLFSL